MRTGRQPALPGSVGRTERRRRRRKGFAFPSGSSAGRARIGSRTIDRPRSCGASRRSSRRSSPYPLTYRLDFLATAGTLVLLAALVAFIPMWLAGLPIGALGTTFAKTIRQLRLPIVTIAFILSIATVMNYSGMTSSMALALARTGVLFPFFAAWLGMIGVFLTGSDTSSNTLVRPAAGDDGANFRAWIRC